MAIIYEFMSTATVTDESEALTQNKPSITEEKHWYAVRTQMNCERRAAELIERKGYPTFLPVQTVVRQWSDRRKKIERIVITMIVFVYTDTAGLREITKLPLVYEPLRNPGERQPASIPTRQLEQLRFMLGHSDAEIEMLPADIKVGDRVKVVRGGLRGLEGNIVRAADGSTDVVIRIDHIGCASVRLSRLDLQPLT